MNVDHTSPFMYEIIFLLGGGILEHLDPMFLQAVVGVLFFGGIAGNLAYQQKLKKE